MPTAIMTDTNSGAENAPGLFVLPMPVIIDRQSYFEGKDLSRADFYAAMREGRDVYSSQPAPGDFLDMWNLILASGYDDIVYIPMSSALSGACETVRSFAESYEGRVYVVDNRRISVTLYESVQEALALAQHGVPAARIKAYLEASAADSSIYIAVNSLEYLKRSGRVTSAGAAIANVLNLKPVLTIQGGKLDAFAKVRGLKNCRRRIVEAVAQDLEERFAAWPREQIHIGAAGTFELEEDAASWQAQLREAFPDYEVYYQPLSCSIACHVGLDAIGVGISRVAPISEIIAEAEGAAEP